MLQANGVGLLLPKHARAQRIQIAINRVLHDPRYRQAAARLGDQIRQADGADVAADAVARFAGVPG